MYGTCDVSRNKFMKKVTRMNLKQKIAQVVDGSLDTNHLKHRLVELFKEWVLEDIIGEDLPGDFFKEGNILRRLFRKRVEEDTK